MSQRSNSCHRSQRMRRTWPSRRRRRRAFWAKGTALGKSVCLRRARWGGGAPGRGRGPVCPQPAVRPGSDPRGAWGRTEQVGFVFCLFSDPSDRRWLLRSVVLLVTEIEAKDVSRVWSDVVQTRPLLALRSSAVGSLSVVGNGSEATRGAPGSLPSRSAAPRGCHKPWSSFAAQLASVWSS